LLGWEREAKGGITFLMKGGSQNCTSVKIFLLTNFILAVKNQGKKFPLSKLLFTLGSLVLSVEFVVSFFYEYHILGAVWHLFNFPSYNSCLEIEVHNIVFFNILNDKLRKLVYALLIFNF
jgi:hypothetical protein